MWRRRFRDEQSEWHSENSPRWLTELERLGPERVRQHLTSYTRQGPRAAIPVGKENSVTKGYVLDWLAWNDSRKVDWDKWRFLLAVAVASCGFVGWVKWSDIVSFMRDLAVTIAG